MTLNNHVSLTITQDAVGIKKAGFGVPLILTYKNLFAGTVKTYSTLTELTADGFAISSPEYLAAQKMLQQTPGPKTFKLGKGSLPPTLAYRIDILAALNTHAYTLNVKGEGVTSTAVSFTSDGTATLAEIEVGLQAALEAVVGENYVVANGAGAGFLTVTADTAGGWFSIENTDVDNLDVFMNHADPGVATDLAAIQLADPDWYGLLTLFNSELYSSAAAGWIETETKIYVAQDSDTRSIHSASGLGLGDDLNTNTYTRSAAIYHPDPATFADAAWAGRVLPEEPGSVTWKFKTLAGVAAVNLTTSHRTNLTGKKENSYESVAGVNITFDGWTADGDYLDNRRGIDKLENEVQTEVFGALAGANKIPYTDPGIAVVEGRVRRALRRMADAGILDPTTIVVTVPKVADVPAADKTARTLKNVQFNATLQGAVHAVEIDGVVSV